MTLLSGWFDRRADTTVLTPRNDVVSGDPTYGSYLPRTLLDGTISLTNDYTASYEDIVRRQLWVRIVVNKMAYTMGRLPLKVYQRVSDTRREPQSSSELAQLLRRPNTSKETGNMPGFIARVAYDLYTYGNAIIVKAQTRPDVLPMALQPFTPRGWRIEGDTYIYRNPWSGAEQSYPSWKVIHLMEPGPTAFGMGVSRLEAARLTLAIEYAAQLLGASTFRNGARPGGIINVRNLPAGKERQPAIERTKAEVVERFGGPSKAGIPAILEGETTWLAMSHNLDDSAVVEHRQLTRGEVAALYDIPQPAVGILDNANFASIDALHVMLYQDTMAWPITLIEAALEHQLIEGVAGIEDYYVEFNLDAAMRGDYLTRMKGHQMSLVWRTPNRIRELENEPPLIGDPDADRLHIAGMTAPDPAVGQGAQNPPGTNTTTGVYTFAANGAGHE